MFYNAVDLSGSKLRGRRSPWSCAEVNAVAGLLDGGVALQNISIGDPYGADRGAVEVCAACDYWLGLLRIGWI